MQNKKCEDCAYQYYDRFREGPICAAMINKSISYPEGCKYSNQIPSRYVAISPKQLDNSKCHLVKKSLNI